MEYLVAVCFRELEEGMAKLLLRGCIAHFLIGADYLILKVEIRVVGGFTIYM